MRCFVVSVVNVCFLVVFLFFLGDKLCLLHEMYTVQAHRIGDESWLRRQCTDPVFFSNMKSHTPICEEVENRARIGALWFALAEVSNSLPLANAWVEVKAVSFPVLAVSAVVMILFPSLIVSLFRYTSPPPLIPFSHSLPSGALRPLVYPPLKQV